MYIRKDHRLENRDTVFALIESAPLGAWVCQTEDGLTANHIPFFLDRTRGKFGTLIGHVARANSVWRQLDANSSSIVMFQGPQAYVTPGWYPGKAEHGKVVPTWDYAVAHAHGMARAIDDPVWLRDMLDRLTQAQEARQATPWRVGDAPRSYIEKLLRAIVGIEIPIDRLEGKLKASQDEDMQDRVGTVEGLRKEAGCDARQMAELVPGAIELDYPADPPTHR